jgi:hypothetical protein
MYKSAYLEEKKQNFTIFTTLQRRLKYQRIVTLPDEVDDIVKIVDNVNR